MINSNILKKITSKKKEVVKIDKKYIWHLFQESSNEILKKEKQEYCQKSKCSYQINSNNEKVLTTILRYFAGIESFNEYGLITNNASLEKGFLISGDIGVGKTLLFSIIKLAGKKLYNETGIKRMSFRDISCGSFVNLYMMASKYSKTLDFDINSYYNGRLYIDDLGVEPMAFNSYELLEQVLFERHRNKAETFITTNLKPSEIEERYGKRIGSRIPQMCNIIRWKGVDYRENL